MTLSVNNRRGERNDIEKNLDLWEEVNRIVAAPKPRQSTERGGITPVILLALLFVLITHLIGIFYFITYRCPCFQ
jgi:hypothetical protein